MDERIDDITSEENQNEKKERRQKNLKMYCWYKLVKKIDNYEELEKETYSKVGVTTKLEKAFFELKRIYKHLEKINATEEKEKKLDYLISYYDFIAKNDSINPDKTDEYCDELIVFIIEYEFELGMKVGLFEEFVNYYNEQNNIIDNKKEKKKN